ncbi:MAG TPA: hypothetical protein VGQ00_00355 [Candidatus Norongarragalinales archaeon]|jgi:hypothetical protein|nr:hypothetical protein [Candidatus Norongarragalinales archaeon]
MRKIEKFLKTGHPKNVIPHLARIKKPELVFIARTHEDKKVQLAALKRLVAFGPAIIPLCKQMFQQKEEHPGAPVWLLLRIGEPGKQVLHEMLREKDPELLKKVLHGIGANFNGPSEFLPEISRIGETHPDPRVRGEAAVAETRMLGLAWVFGGKRPKS